MPKLYETYDALTDENDAYFRNSIKPDNLPNYEVRADDVLNHIDSYLNETKAQLPVAQIDLNEFVKDYKGRINDLEERGKLANLTMEETIELREGKKDLKAATRWYGAKIKNSSTVDQLLNKIKIPNVFLPKKDVLQDNRRLIDAVLQHSGEGLLHKKIIDFLRDKLTQAAKKSLSKEVEAKMQLETKYDVLPESKEVIKEESVEADIFEESSEDFERKLKGAKAVLEKKAVSEKTKAPSVNQLRDKLETLQRQADVLEKMVKETKNKDAKMDLIDVVTQISKVEDKIDSMEKAEKQSRQSYAERQKMPKEKVKAIEAAQGKTVKPAAPKKSAKKKVTVESPKAEAPTIEV